MTPRGLRLLAQFTGILRNEERGELHHAYAAAVALAAKPPASTIDCDPLYHAISTVLSQAHPLADNKERGLEDELEGHTLEEFNHVILARTDAACLFGFAFAYVLMTTIGRSDGAR